MTMSKAERVFEFAVCVFVAFFMCRMFLAIL